MAASFSFLFAALWFTPASAYAGPQLSRRTTARWPQPRASFRALPRLPRAQPSLFALADTSVLLSEGAALHSLTAWDPTGVARWGWWVLIAWMFAAQAKVCDSFFIPAIEACSRKFEIPEDVAGATLMAFGCNGPELFVNAISIFVTHNDVGVGTIVGSEIFNLLCIVGGSALVAPISPLPVERTPFVRDSAFYALAAVLLAVVVRDGRVERPEALALVAMAAIYAYAVSATAGAMASAGVKRCVVPEGAAEGEAEAEADGSASSRLRMTLVDEDGCAVVCGVPMTAEVAGRTDFVCELPEEEGAASAAGGLGAMAGAAVAQAGVWLDASLQPFGWVLERTVPDCRPATAASDEQWLPAFAVSMAWLAICSLAVCLTADQLTVDFGIPSSVIGLTIAAAGTSFANLFSSLVESRRGRVGMAVANALGSNVQNVFLALGIPWVAYTLLNPASSPLLVSAAGIGEGVWFMLGTLGVFFACTALSDFTISKSLARGMFGAYGFYLVYTCAPLLLHG